MFKVYDLIVLIKIHANVFLEEFDLIQSGKCVKKEFYSLTKFLKTHHSISIILMYLMI